MSLQAQTGNPVVYKGGYLEFLYTILTPVAPERRYGPDGAVIFVMDANKKPRFIKPRPLNSYKFHLFHPNLPAGPAPLIRTASA